MKVPLPHHLHSPSRTQMGEGSISGSPPPIIEAPVTVRQGDTSVVSEKVNQSHGQFNWPISLENNQLI